MGTIKPQPHPTWYVDEVVKPIIAQMNAQQDPAKPEDPPAPQDEGDTMTVGELVDELTLRRRKAKVLIHLADGKGRVIEGELPNAPPKTGVGDDALNVVYLYGVITAGYDEQLEQALDEYREP
jgi:hypothetical protein